MQKIKFRWLATLATVTLLVLPAASHAAVEDLLSSPTRPTIADLEREAPLAKYPDLPFCKGQSYNFEPDSIARFIAELEWAYPGAIYMPLGRDVVLIGDHLDAFYHSIGEPGRVMRLSASGHSLRGSEALIARFVQSSGVNFETLTDSPGYIFFDGSNYGLPNGSQSTMILNEVYKAYEQTGRSREDLLDKFAFFNTYFSNSTHGVAVVPGLDRAAFFEERRAELKEGKIPQKHFASQSQIYGSSEWHSTFQRLQEQPDGSVIAPPPGEDGHNVRENRKAMLCQMRALMKMTAETSFLAKVRAQAKALGYEFRTQRATECSQELAKH